MSAIKNVAAVLKARFGSLTLEETIDLAEKLVAAAQVPLTEEEADARMRGGTEAGLRITLALEAALDASKCGHGRLHIFCGQCSPLSVQR
jgi:hypothetical protein